MYLKPTDDLQKVKTKVSELSKRATIEAQEHTNRANKSFYISFSGDGKSLQFLAPNQKLINLKPAQSIVVIIKSIDNIIEITPS